MPRATDERRTRLKGWMLLDMLRLRAMSRQDIEEHYGLKATTVQTHITLLRGTTDETRQIYIAEWREPKKTGMWTPVYRARTALRELDVPHPPRGRGKAIVVPKEDEGLPVRARGTGVRKEHAVMATAFGVMQIDGEPIEVGVWGALVPRVRRAAIAAS